MTEKDRLCAFEKMYCEIYELYENGRKEIEDLKAQNKEKTYRFKELAEQQLLRNYVIKLYEQYGLSEKQKGR